MLKYWNLCEWPGVEGGGIKCFKRQHWNCRLYMDTIQFAMEE